MAGPPPPQSEFEKQAQETQVGLLREYWEFLRDNKKWWMIPILLILGVCGLFIALASTGAAPFIYTLF